MNSKKNKELPKWFDGLHYSEGRNVTDPFSGEEFYLNRTELSMYDFIKGAEFTIIMGGKSNQTKGIQKDMIKALDWFRKANSKAYVGLKIG